MRSSYSVYFLCVIIAFSIAEAHRCRLCTELVDSIESDGLSTVLAQKKSVIESICSRAPSTFQARCSSTAADLLKTITRQMERGVGAKEVCDNMCTHHSVGSGGHANRRVGEDWGCFICEAAMTICERYRPNTTSYNESYVTVQVQDLCKTFIPKGREQDMCMIEASILVKAVYGGANPATLCVEFKQCNATESFYLKPIKALISGSADDCDVCRTAAFLTRLASKSPNPVKPEVISDRLHGLCESFDIECGTILDMVPSLVKQINNGTHRVCKHAGVCPSRKYQNGNHWGNFVDRSV